MTPVPPRPARFWRPTVSHVGLNILVATYILAAQNEGFWHRMAGIFGQTPLQMALFSAAVFALTLLTLELFGPGRLQKPVAALLILVSAGANYYERNFGILIDREMVRNILETTVTESRHLMTRGALLSILLTGVLPAALVFWPRVNRVRTLHQLWRWPLGVTLCFALVAGGLLADFKTFSAVLRERKELMGSYQPGASIAAVTNYARQQYRSGATRYQATALDARPGPRLSAAQKPVLLVLFVGETLRAMNFGLNGYDRDTTPELRKRNVINFPDVSSCGTSTAVSLPCMFSPLTQAGYSRDKFMAQDNLVDVLARAGFAVRWVDNNTGDQNIALRTGWERVDATLTPEDCVVECTDAAFLPIIRQTLDTISADTVLVLHMVGNHGPAYYLRYPKERAAFLPDCQTAEFADCAVSDIVNAYDNATLQTDYVLSRTIDMLSASDKALTSMFFLSDHGESLGEGGLYLHSAPLFMAPETQTKVPMVMWMAPAFQSAMGIDTACLTRTAQAPASQDNLFHTVLGMLDVTTALRMDNLDLTAACKTSEGQHG